ncbi:MAG: acyl-CoA thioesterase [Gemmatimonadales bacterium]|jgi:acyl-CoA thioester hydrolase|nr:acyl-CoA thioesterase [Gemmatimonadales bacterium]
MAPHSSELPPAPPVYELPLGILPDDIDALGHVNNTVYLRWVQDAAVAHWRQLAPADAQATVFWVVLRHEIDYKRAVGPDDAVVARTWVGHAERLSFERHTEIVRRDDGALVAKARTVWCPVDATTGRPRRVTDELRALFSTPAGSGGATA